jgi:hypothetical protein
MTTKLTTPAGRLVWPKLQVAECYREDGQAPTPQDKYHYSTKMVLDPEDEEVATFIKDLENMANELVAEEQAKGKKKAPVKDPLFSMKPDTDQDGNETGMTIFSFRTLAGGVKDGKPWTRKVPLLDHENDVFDAGDESLGNGTFAKVSIEPRAYKSGGAIGVTLQLRAVKILAAKFFKARGGPESDFEDDVVTAEEFETIQENHGTGGDF